MGDSSFVKIGPRGNNNGNVWDQKGKDKIVQIFIWHDDNTGIKSIQFQYAENNRTFVLSERQGSSDGSNFDVVKLRHPAEYITWISGYCKYSGDLLSLTFGTNLGRKYGPFGCKDDDAGQKNKFSLRLGENNQFGGFHGTFDNNGIKSIGVYLKPNTTTVLH